MTQFRITLALFALLAFVASCATWEALSKEQRLDLVVDSLVIVVKPECLRFADSQVGTSYKELCEEIFDDIVASVRAGVLKDLSEVCPSIASKVERCSAIPGEYNVATCERLVRAADLACRVFTLEPAGSATDVEARAIFQLNTGRV